MDNRRLVKKVVMMNAGDGLMAQWPRADEAEAAAADREAWKMLL
jgi:hypothetical protein